MKNSNVDGEWSGGEAHRLCTNMWHGAKQCRWDEACEGQGLRADGDWKCCWLALVEEQGTWRLWNEDWGTQRHDSGHQCQHRWGPETQESPGIQTYTGNNSVLRWNWDPQWKKLIPLAMVLVHTSQSELTNWLRFLLMGSTCYCALQGPPWWLCRPLRKCVDTTNNKEGHPPVPVKWVRVLQGFQNVACTHTWQTPARLVFASPVAKPEKDWNWTGVQLLARYDTLLISLIVRVPSFTHARDSFLFLVSPILRQSIVCCGPLSYCSLMTRPLATSSIMLFSLLICWRVSKMCHPSSLTLTRPYNVSSCLY